MFAYRVRRKLARWFPRLVAAPGQRSDRSASLNATMAEIPIDPRRYGTTDEFSFVLRPSQLSGVGVFCTHGIAKGARLALFPDLKPRYVSDDRQERDPRLQAFCRVYGVDVAGGSVVARSFSHMHVGWYLNHSDQPNAHHERFKYFASRDIEANEEITIDYRDTALGSRGLSPKTNAAIIYVMDVSGSMGDEQKEIVRTESFWLDAWISAHYEGTRSVYIVHDASAKEVDRDTFFRIRESGGTVISSAYELAIKIIQERFPPDDWNLYLFHFTDGENYSRQDTEKCMQLLDKRLLPALNLFGYGQVESYGTSGDFFEAVQRHFKTDPRVTMAHIPNRDAVVDCIKTFLGKGR